MNQEPKGYTVREPTTYEIEQDTLEKTAKLNKYSTRILSSIFDDESFTVEVMNSIVKHISTFFPNVPGIQQFVENYNAVHYDDDKKRVFVDFIQKSKIEQLDVIRNIYHNFFIEKPTYGGGKRSTGKKGSQKQKKKTRSSKKKAKAKASRRR